MFLSVVIPVQATLKLSVSMLNAMPDSSLSRTRFEKIPVDPLGRQSQAQDETCARRNQWTLFGGGFKFQVHRVTDDAIA